MDLLEFVTERGHHKGMQFKLSPEIQKVLDQLFFIENRHLQIIHFLELEMGSLFVRNALSKADPITHFRIRTEPLLSYPPGPARTRQLQILSKKVLMSEAECLKCFYSEFRDESHQKAKTLLLQGAFQFGKKLSEEFRLHSHTIRFGPGLKGTWIAVSLALFDGLPWERNSIASIQKETVLQIERFSWPYLESWKLQNAPLEI